MADVTQKFIKMCDCPEIQSWTRKAYALDNIEVGDYYAVKEGDEYAIYPVVLYGKFYEKDKWVIKHQKATKPVYLPTDAIWIPRIDQLYDLINFPTPDQPLLFLTQMYKHVIEGDKRGGLAYPPLQSMEQLTISYIMRKMHEKMWDDSKEEWVWEWHYKKGDE